jgi:3-hydroxyacyl-[acyl-carrier-protein] dehydratase
VLEIDPGQRVVAIKNVTMNEPQFTGHWPENPVMPGVLILEAMAQVGGIMILVQSEDAGKTPFFAGCDEIRWRRRVVPGDQLIIEATMERRKGRIGRARAVARVGDEVACEGVLMFALE